MMSSTSGALQILVFASIASLGLACGIPQAVKCTLVSQRDTERIDRGLRVTKRVLLGKFMFCMLDTTRSITIHWQTNNGNNAGMLSL